MTREMLSVLASVLLLQNSTLVGQVRPLVPGESIRDYVGDKGAAYELALMAGDVAEVIVSQPNGDLRLRVTGPSGGELVRVNMRRPAQGDERVLIVAGTDGLHSVVVETAGPQAGDAPFMVTLKPIRRATAVDAAFAEAMKKYSDAEREASRGTAAARERAASWFRESHEVWKAHGARFEEAAALQQIAFAGLMSGNLPEAAAGFQEAAHLRRQIGDRYGEGVALHNLASTIHRRGEYEKAAALYDDALRVRREVGDRDGKAWTLVGQGVTNAIVENGWKPAVPLFQQALEIFREVTDARGEAEALYYLGYSYKSLGDHPFAARSGPRGAWHRS